MKGLLTSLRRAAARAAGRADDDPPLPSERQPRRVLFVCMGNICRSPTAAGVFAKVLKERAPDLDVEIESAGTHAYHVGDAPDPRARRAAERRGVDLSALRARQVTDEDFAQFELVLAMDVQNRTELIERSPAEYHERIRLFLEFAPQLGREDVPDPYYGGSNGFEYVLDLVEEASLGLVEHLRRTTPPSSGAAQGSTDEA